MDRRRNITQAIDYLNRARRVTDAHCPLCKARQGFMAFWTIPRLDPEPVDSERLARVMKDFDHV